MQGYALQKPHGYAGDYEMIDKVYQYHMCRDPYLVNWDRYAHAQSTPIAVRNRKEYFKRMLSRLAVDKQGVGPLHVLNVASGPARDVFEFLCEQNGKRVANVTFDCIDLDLDAIGYARELCADFQEQLNFINGNALRFRTDTRYHLIWSGGLFDYFRDRTFKCLLKRLLTFLDEDGELVIGNIAEGNPTRDYLEIVTDWFMYYRTAEDLVSLAMECGVRREDLRISKEALGAIWFLHIKRGSEFRSV
jgi:SAM-dependent methyltransferase